MNRRKFLASCAVAPVVGAQTVRRNEQPGLRYRRLGRTNFMISEVVFGTLPVKPDRWEHVELAVDMGLNYLDTAASYGNGASERGLANVLRGHKRDRVFLNTKVSPWIHNRNALFQEIYDSLPEADQRKLHGEMRKEIERRRADEPDYFCGYFNGQKRALEASILSNVMEQKFGNRIDRKKSYRDIVIRSVEESLSRLETDHLDLMICPHGANSREEVTRFPEIFEAFETLKRQGKVSHLGVSAHSDPAGVLLGAIEAEVYSFAMIAYNVVNHEYVDKALERAAAADFGVIAMKAARPIYPNRQRLDPGASVKPEWIAKIKKAVPGPMKLPLKGYKWALRDPRIAAVCSEMTSEEIIRENLGLATQES